MSGLSSASASDACTAREAAYLRFGTTTFVRSVGRLLVTLGLAGGTLALPQGQ